MALIYILQLTRIHGQSRTLINNIFSNQYKKKPISGNLISTISNHLPQFLFAPSILSGRPSSKLEIYQRNWTKFNKEDFIFDYFEKDWDSVLDLSSNDMDFSFLVQ